MKRNWILTIQSISNLICSCISRSIFEENNDDVSSFTNWVSCKKAEKRNRFVVRCETHYLCDKINSLHLRYTVCSVHRQLLLCVIHLFVCWPAFHFVSIHSSSMLNVNERKRKICSVYQSIIATAHYEINQCQRALLLNFKWHWHWNAQ